MELKDLCGEHIFSGIETGILVRRDDWSSEECQYVKFELDNCAYVAVENPSDGYRSYCEELVKEITPCKIKLPNIRVEASMESGDNDVLVLTDCKTNLVVLRVGTKDYNDYYPFCVMEWHPENLCCNQL